ncbi:glycosyltransferase [Halorussus halobius]|uniref:glycosyltransferase n=1 Tax=Halorussus halobius TaxID=1710537 RepID=UPI001092AD31|nr:glycosyltransferase [Halorussus halobius]
MSGRILFHTPTKLTGKADSGSKVRPAKMYQSFQELGYTVDLISGPAENRLRDFKTVMENDREYVFCYSEPSTWPTNPFVDYRIYYYLYRNRIPTGIFYRDIYWKFPELFGPTGLKKWELQLRYRSDLKVFDTVADVLYCPSTSFSDFLEVSTQVEPLPPAGVDKTHNQPDNETPDRAIYVGGVSKRYGTDLLAKSFKKVNEESDFQLELVCREEEYYSLPSAVREDFAEDWVTVHHVSGEELDDLYEDVDVGISPIRPTEYNNAAMAVKLFEYLSYGLPIVTTNCDEMASFVSDNNCGFICDDSAEAMASTLLYLQADTERFVKAKEESVTTLKQGNLWIDRARSVASFLQD